MNYAVILGLRKKYNISQIKLAEISGYSPAVISSWERKVRIPGDEDLEKVHLALMKAISDIESRTFDIRKKRIRRSPDGGAGGARPALIRSGEEYRALCARMKRPEEPTPYVRRLRSLYAGTLEEKKENAVRTLALFSGCGGMSLGFDSAGCSLVGHLDIDPSANRIYGQNFPRSDLLGGDIRDVTDEEMRRWEARYGKIDLIIGGPPCQGFSLAGKRDPEDGRNQLYKYYVHMVSVLKPRVFVMENVRLLTSMKTAEGHLFIDDIMADFDRAGYAVFKKEINAADYGVPQTRERIILVGADRDFSDRPFVFPAPTHGADCENAGEKYTTFRDAVMDLESVESGEASSDPLHWAVRHPAHVISWLKDVPEGCSAHENKDPSKRPLSGFNTTYKRIVWDEPCSTISTNFSMISGCRNVHPQATRALTIREAARAQSFPDEFVFTGKWGDIRRVIGNAVPPLLARALAGAILREYFSR